MCCQGFEARGFYACWGWLELSVLLMWNSLLYPRGKRTALYLVSWGACSSKYCNSLLLVGNKKRCHRLPGVTSGLWGWERCCTALHWPLSAPCFPVMKWLQNGLVQCLGLWTVKLISGTSTGSCFKSVRGVSKRGFVGKREATYVKQVLFLKRSWGRLFEWLAVGEM